MSAGEVVRGNAQRKWRLTTGPASYALQFLAFVLLYYACGKVGLSIGQLNPNVTPLWPGAGLAIAGLLVLGRQYWPAVAVGAFTLNLTNTGDAFAAAVIASGNTAEAVIVVYLLARFGDGLRAFERASGVFLFAASIAFAAALSATLGTGVLQIVHLVPEADVLNMWAAWWAGNVAGALLITPVLALWSRPFSPTRRASRWLEGAVLLALILVVGFDPTSFIIQARAAGPPTGLFLLPLVVWASFRFSPREAATGTLLLSLGTIWNSLQNRGPFGTGDPAETQLVLALALAALGFVSLLLAALVADRRREAETIRRARDELDSRVVERTAALSVAVQRLRDEITERERAEENLRRSQARLVEAQRLAQLGNWEWDIGTNAFTASDELRRLTGLAASDFPKTFDAFLQRIHPDDRARIRSTAYAARDAQQAFETEGRILRPEGAVRWMHFQGRIEHNAEGQAARVSGNAQDVTERRRLERERAEAQERAKEIHRLQELNDLKTRFMNTAAHELNTPLTPIRVQLHILKQRVESGEAGASDSLAVLERNIERMIGLVNDVLEAARLQAERLGIRKESVDLARLVRDAAESFHAPAREAGLRLEVDADAALPAEADPKRVTQVLYNLLSNAIKFTPRGGRVRIEARSSVGGAELRVSDTGIGLTGEQIERLFQPFSQVHEGVLTSRLGTGLGLYISRGIAELHGGSIRVESQGPSRGTTFILTIPLVAREPISAQLVNAL